MSYDKVIFELSRPGRKGYNLPPLDVEDKGLENYIPDEFRDDNELDFPEVSEVDVIRHYTNLSQYRYYHHKQKEFPSQSVLWSHRNTIWGWTY